VHTGGDPFALQQVSGVRVGQNRACATWSHRTRLISSGISRLKERKPASTCATGTWTFSSRQRPRQRGIGIPEYDAPVRSLPQQNLFDLDQHPPGLFGMAAAADPQVDIRFGDAKLIEKDLRHVVVIVLAGMHQDLFPSLAQRF
jgi:hypothetical protein